MESLFDLYLFDDESLSLVWWFRPLTQVISLFSLLKVTQTHLALPHPHHWCSLLLHSLLGEEDRMKGDKRVKRDKGKRKGKEKIEGYFDHLKTLIITVVMKG